MATDDTYVRRVRQGRGSIAGICIERNSGPGWPHSLVDVLLARADLEQVHLDPLVGRPGPTWNQLAKRALDSGYVPEDLVPAVHGHGWSWSGNESTMWDGWAEAFGLLEDNEDV